MRVGYIHSCRICPNPQWVSVNGILIFLECLGKHRGLSVHLSFVRMDKWKDVELEKMKAGGNKKFKDFLQFYPDDWDDHMTIQQKYNYFSSILTWKDSDWTSATEWGSWDESRAKNTVKESRTASEASASRTNTNNNSLKGFSTSKVPLRPSFQNKRL